MMRGNILYGSSTAPPALSGHFQRPRIEKLLQGFMDRNLIVVSAGAGSGKTHAVSAFLNESNARVFWFQLSELDNNPKRFFEQFVYLTAFIDEETAAKLEQLGLPDNLTKYDKFLHIMARLIYSSEQVVIVFDDYHLIKEAVVIDFVKNLVDARLENLCIILNTREKLGVNLVSFLSNDLIALITAQDLYFTPDETDEYLRSKGISLSEREVMTVLSFTQGWPVALYLVGLSLAKGGMITNDPIAGAAPAIFELIQKELFSKYTEPIREFLIKASLLSSFPQGIVDALAGDCRASNFLDDNMFVSYNPRTCNYSFHNLFLEFLKGKQKQLPDEVIRDTYRTAAKWSAENGRKLEALSYYDKCGEYDEVLNLMLNFGVAVFTQAMADYYISLIDRFPPELLDGNPMLYVHRAGLHYNNARAKKAIEDLHKAIALLEEQEDGEKRREALGEIYCMLGIIKLGMADYEFVDHFTRAARYLPDKSKMFNNSGMIVNTRYAAMLNSTAQGELKNMTDTLFEIMPVVTDTLRGYGSGFEFLAAAEAAYFTADMKKAAKFAYEAVYRAVEGGVADVAASGYLLLMKVESANGNYQGVIKNLEKMRSYVGNLNDKWNFNGMPDIADGWFNLYICESSKLAGWIIDDELRESVLAPYSVGMEIAIKARYLFAQGKYYELLAWLNRVQRKIKKRGITLVVIDIMLFSALTSFKVADEANAIESLSAAYELSHNNSLKMQFIEQGNELKKMIYKLRQNPACKLPKAWLDELSSKAATYEKHVKSIRSRHLKQGGGQAKTAIKVTDRERQMLGYLCQGLTNAQIADECYITVSAVKKALNNIYIKLGATNRADAVREALQMDLIS